MKWYKRDPHRWFEGTRELAWEERGVYADMVDIALARDGRLPNDDRFLCVAIGGNVRSIRRIKSALIAKRKVRIERRPEGEFLVPNGVEYTREEAYQFDQTFGKLQSNRRKKGIKNNGPRDHSTTQIVEEEPIRGSSSTIWGDKEKSSTPETLEQRRKRVQRELETMSDEEITKWNEKQTTSQ